MNEIKVLITGASNFGKGGVSTIAWNLCTNINNDKIHVDFFSDKVSVPQFLDDAQKLGINFYLTGKKKNKLINWINKYIKLNKVLKENKYSCVHINASVSFSALVYSMAARKHKARVIIHSHSTNVDSIKFKNIKRIVHCLLKSIVDFKHASLMACSDLAAEWMFPKNIIKNKKYTVIKNGVEVDKFIFNGDIRNKIRKELHAENKFIIGHIGRFAYQKNHTFLVDVFSEIYKRNRNAVLLLVGDGPLRSEIEEKANKLGLTNNVIFYGTTDKANEIYQAMDCFVLPSHFEGLPVVSAEAQASGLHTLFADTITSQAKITELLEYMSLSDSVEKWAEKILSYDNGYERKDMSEQIRTAGYDIKHSAKQLENIYLECVKQ